VCRHGPQAAPGDRRQHLSNIPFSTDRPSFYGLDLPLPSSVDRLWRSNRGVHRSKRYTAHVSVSLSVPFRRCAKLAGGIQHPARKHARAPIASRCQTFDLNVRLYQPWAGSNKGTYDNEKDYRRPCSYRAPSPGARRAVISQGTAPGAETISKPPKNRSPVSSSAIRCPCAASPYLFDPESTPAKPCSTLLVGRIRRRQIGAEAVLRIAFFRTRG
jgi:hypothetical protein